MNVTWTSTAVISTQPAIIRLDFMNATVMMGMAAMVLHVTVCQYYQTSLFNILLSQSDTIR